MLMWMDLMRVNQTAMPRLSIQSEYKYLCNINVFLIKQFIFDYYLYTNIWYKLLLYKFLIFKAIYYIFLLRAKIILYIPIKVFKRFHR